MDQRRRARQLTRECRRAAAGLFALLVLPTHPRPGIGSGGHGRALRPRPGCHRRCPDRLRDGGRRAPRVGHDRLRHARRRGWPLHRPGVAAGRLRDSPLLRRLLPGADGCARQRAQPVLRPWRHPARSSGGFPGGDHRDGGDAPGAGGWHRHATVPARRGAHAVDRIAARRDAGPSGRHGRPGRQSPAAGQRPRGHPDRRQAVEPDRLRQSARTRQRLGRQRRGDRDYQQPVGQLRRRRHGRGSSTSSTGRNSNWASRQTLACHSATASSRSSAPISRPSSGALPTTRRSFPA